jgi:hypothetical protein
MSDVISFEEIAQSAKQARQVTTLKDRFGDDEYLLKWCAEWRAARAQQQKNWAEHELANGWGTLPDSHLNLDLEPLQRMQELESLLAEAKPRTILLARELLGIAITILAHEGEDPDSVLAHGPVLDIVRNVGSSLEWLTAETRLGPKKRRRRH